MNREWESRVTRSTKPWLLGGALIVGLAAAGGGWMLTKGRAQAAPAWTSPPTKVAVAAVLQATQAQQLTGIGTLEAARQVSVPAESDGRVAQILFSPGERVRAGQLLVQLNDAPEQGELARLQAQAVQTKAALERTRRLLPQQAATQEQMDQAQSAHDQVQGELQRVRALIAQKRIAAPFDGVLGIRQVHLGQFVRAGDALVSLTDGRVMHANLTLPESAYAVLRREQRVRLRVDAYPGRDFVATLSTIEPQVDPATRTVRLQATLKNPDGLLVPGIYVNAAVALAPRPDVLSVPETAVTYNAYGDSVYVVESGAKGGGLSVRQVQVKTGERDQGRVVVTQGLKAGERVVTSGQLRLYNGAAVEISAQDTLAPKTPAAAAASAPQGAQPEAGKGQP